MSWQPIETAPLHQEVLFYREDTGVLFGKYTSMDGELSDDEIETLDWSEDEIFEPDFWWYHPHLGLCRLEGDLRPTHWMRLPEPPEVPE